MILPKGDGMICYEVLRRNNLGLNICGLLNCKKEERRIFIRRSRRLGTTGAYCPILKILGAASGGLQETLDLDTEKEKRQISRQRGLEALESLLT